MTALATWLLFIALAWTGSKVATVAEELTAIRKLMEQRREE